MENTRKNMTFDEKIESLDKDILEAETNPVFSRYGEELGTAKLVREGRTFRIFSKEVQKSKSGKAVLVELKAFVQKDGEEFALVRGHTFLPNFVLENKDVYWILENKIHGKTRGADDLSIDGEYIPKEFNIRGNFWSHENKETAEEHTTNWISFLKNFKKRMVEEHRVETNIISSMQIFA